MQGESSDITITEDDIEIYSNDKDFKTNAVKATIEAVISVDSYEACPTHLKKLGPNDHCTQCNTTVSSPLHKDFATVLLQNNDNLEELVMFHSVITSLKEHHGITDIADLVGIEDNFVVRDNKIFYIV